jgi:hypothetical protein
MEVRCGYVEFRLAIADDQALTGVAYVATSHVAPIPGELVIYSAAGAHFAYARLRIVNIEPGTLDPPGVRSLSIYNESEPGRSGSGRIESRSKS